MGRNTNNNLHVCLVFVSCYLALFLHVGLIYSIGTIFEDVMSAFNSSRAETAVIHSTALAVGMGTGLLSGVLIHKYGVVVFGIVGASLGSIGLMACYFSTSTAYMVVTFGIIYAFGGPGCLYISSTIAIGQTFHGKRKMLMISLHSTGSAVGGMVYPYLLAYLSDTYGFRGALLIVGGFSMNCIPGCLLWKRTTIRDEQNSDGNNSDRLRKYEQNTRTKITRNADEITVQAVSTSRENNKTYVDNFPVLSDDSNTRTVTVNYDKFNRYEQSQTIVQSIKTLIKKTTFVIFAIGSVAVHSSLFIIVIFVTDLFVDKNLTLNDASFGLVLMNIMNILGRVLPGAMIQSKHISSMCCPLFTSCMASFVLVGIALSTSRNLTVGILGVSGIPFGMSIAMISVISAQLVGTRNLSTAIGIITSANGIGNAIAGPVGGYIRDISGSYTLPLYFAAGMMVFSTLLFAIALVKEKRNLKKRNHCQRSSVFYLTSM